MSFLNEVKQKLWEFAINIFLNRIGDPDTKRICEHIFGPEFFNSLIHGRILIPKELIIDEVKKGLAPIKMITLRDHYFTDEQISLILSYSDIFVVDLEVNVELTIKFAGLRIDDEAQRFVVQYTVNDSFDETLLTSILGMVIRPILSVFLKTQFDAIDLITISEPKANVGWLVIDLGCHQDFKKLKLFSTLNYRIFRLITFSEIRTSRIGVEIISNTTWKEFYVNLKKMLGSRKQPLHAEISRNKTLLPMPVEQNPR